MGCSVRSIALLAFLLLHFSVRPGVRAQRSSAGGSASTGTSGSLRSGRFSAGESSSSSGEGSSFGGGSTSGSSGRGSGGNSGSSGGVFGSASNGGGSGSSGGFVSTLGSSSGSRGGTSSNNGGTLFGSGSITSESSSGNGNSNNGNNNNGNNGQGNAYGAGNGNSGNKNGNSGESNGNGGNNGNSGNKNGNSGESNGNSGNGNNGNSGNNEGSSSSSTSSTSSSKSTSGVTSVSGGTASQCGSGGKTNCAGGNSDPVMYGFAGRSFNFIGDPGKIYNIISTFNLQISMKLKLAQMWDHNGTNMEAIGIMYRNYKVLIYLDDKQEVAVTAQGRTLKVKNTAKHYAWRFEDGAYIETTWERYKPGLGNTVIIDTDIIKITIWQTPAGIVDEGGMILEAWLNFGIELQAPPANGVMHGIVGGTYDRFIAGEAAVSDPESQLYLPPDESFHGAFKDWEYAMADHWDTNFPANLFGVTHPFQPGRSTLEVDDPPQPSAFPAFANACFQCHRSAHPFQRGIS